MLLSELEDMRQSLLTRISHLLDRSKRRKLALLWDKAEPVSTEELKTMFTELARKELIYKPDQRVVDSDSLNFDELWQIFESLEDLDDCPVIS